MNTGTRVTIIISDELREIKLEDIVNRCGTIAEDLTMDDRINKGYMVNLDESYLQENNWFIPEASVLKI